MCGVCGNPSCSDPEDHEDPRRDDLFSDEALREYDQMLEDEYEAEHRREQRERRQRNELWERHEEEEFRDAMDAAEDYEFFAGESLLFPDDLPYDDLTPGRTFGELASIVEEAMFDPDDLPHEVAPTLDAWRFRKRS